MRASYVLDDKKIIELVKMYGNSYIAYIDFKTSLSHSVKEVFKNPSKLYKPTFKALKKLFGFENEYNKNG